MTGARTATLGAFLVVIYTGLISSADGITKLIAGGYAAPQLYSLSGLIVMALCLAADRHRTQRRGLSTTCPRAMAVRSGATVLAAVSFFYAFRFLPFADVFLFIALMPILAAVLSGVILKERASTGAWAALGAGFIGVFCLFPAGLASMSAGHAFSLAAVFFGTLSMVMARYIGQREDNALAQVFYPNAAIFVAMALALPFVWQPMPLADLGWVAAYVVTPLMNLQFVWMVLIGAMFFGELPGATTYLGAAIVIASGVFLVWDQFAPFPARGGRLRGVWLALFRPGRLRSDP